MMRTAAAMVLLLTAWPLYAQDIPPKGSPSTLDVATWNIEWFGSRSNGPSDEDLQLENARRIIVASEIDLWALQEIDDERHFDRLLEALGPDYDGQLGGASTNLKVGFIFKRAVVDPIQIGDAWLAQFSTSFAGRPPLLMEADVTLPDTIVTLHFVALHMKCCGDGYEQRLDASNRIKTRMDVVHDAEPFIFVGDFNDELGGSISGSNPSPYQNFLDDEDDYSFTTLPIDANGEDTWCGNRACTSGSSLDHILITNELFSAYIDESTARYDELLSAVDDYVTTTSDHLPVYARFSFPIDTSIDDDLPVAERMSIYPNPVSDFARISHDGGTSRTTVLEVFDLLGRRVQMVEVPAYMNGTIELPTSKLIPGVYVVRVTAGDRAVMRQMVVAR